MIQFNLQTEKAKRRYVIYMDRQMKIFERFCFRKFKIYFREQYKKMARRIRETDDLRIEKDLEMNKMFALLMNIYHRVANHYSKLFVESVQKVFSKSLIDVFWEKYRNWAKMYAAERVTNINNTTKKRITRIITTGLEQQKTNRQIARDIYALREIDSIMRANRIANTEIHTMSNKTMFDMAKDEKMIDVKDWLSAIDERVRAAHLTMGDVFVESEMPSVVPIDSYFDVGGELLNYPGDPAGSGWNIVNCRCFLAYYTRQRGAVYGN